MPNPTALILMGFEVAILVITAVCVYLKLIPNDLLILALGVVIRGALGVVPTTAAISANTLATKENTAVTLATTPTAEIPPVAK
jgi:hypothetical protein